MRDVGPLTTLGIDTANLHKYFAQICSVIQGICSSYNFYRKNVLNLGGENVVFTPFGSRNF